MATPRSRLHQQTGQTSLKTVSASSQTLELGSLLNTSLWSNLDPSVQLGVSRREVIQDWVTDPGEKRGYNYCSHIKTTASVSRGKYNCSFSPPEPLNGTVEWSIPVLAHSALQPEFDFAPLVTSLAEKVRGSLNSQSYLWVTMAELAKTWAMVRNPMSLLSPKSLALNGWKTAAQLAKTASSLWLEWRYGWKPLMGDIKNYCNSYVTYTNEARRIGLAQDSTRFAERGTSTVSASPTYWGETEQEWKERRLDPLGTCFSVSNSNRGWARAVFSPYTVSAAVGTRGDLVARKFNSRLRLATAVLNAGPDALFSTIWELLPFSFVVDWFINLRGIMGLADSRRFLADLGGIGYSVKWKQDYIVHYLPDRFPWYRRWPYYYSPTVAIRDGSIESQHGTRSGYVRNPGLPGTDISEFCNTDLSLLHKLDSVGLIAQLIVK